MEGERDEGLQRGVVGVVREGDVGETENVLGTEAKEMSEPRGEPSADVDGEATTGDMMAGWVLLLLFQSCGWGGERCFVRMGLGVGREGSECFEWNVNVGEGNARVLQWREVGFAWLTREEAVLNCTAQ